MANQQFAIDPVKAQRAVDATAACAADVSRDSTRVDQELSALTSSGAAFSGEAQRALASAHQKAQECARKLQVDLNKLSELLSSVKGSYTAQDSAAAAGLTQITKSAGAGLPF